MGKKDQLVEVCYVGPAGKICGSWHEPGHDGQYVAVSGNFTPDPQKVLRVAASVVEKFKALFAAPTAKQETKKDQPAHKPVEAKE